MYQELFPGPQEAANIPFVMFWMPNSASLSWTSRLHYSIPAIVQVVVLLGFAYWGISRLTNYVMGTNNRISRIRIVDLDQEGKVLRENDLSLLMFSTPKRERIEMGSGYVTRLWSTPTGFDQPGYDSRRWANLRPRYIGRVPNRYAVEIDAEQWNPEQYRTVRFTNTDPIPEFPWKKYVESELLKSVSGEMALRLGIS